MSWFAAVFSTVFLFLVSLFLWRIMYVSAEKKQQEKKKQPTYEELRRNVNILLCWLFFVSFWLVSVAPRVNWSLWSFWGANVTGLFYWILLAVALLLMRWVIIVLDRKKSAAQELGHNNG
jgi:flagellar biosynthesis/type III secretory pathway M-ring protein FliF/YscJ